MTCVAVDWEECYWNQRRALWTFKRRSLAYTLPCCDLASIADCMHQIALVLCSPATHSLEKQEWDSLKVNLQMSLSLSFGSFWPALGCYIATVHRWMSQQACIKHAQNCSLTQGPTGVEQLHLYHETVLLSKAVWRMGPGLHQIPSSNTFAWHLLIPSVGSCINWSISSPFWQDS